MLLYLAYVVLNGHMQLRLLSSWLAVQVVKETASGAVWAEGLLCIVLSQLHCLAFSPSWLLCICVFFKHLQLINEKPQIIQDYESGKAIPNPQVRSSRSSSSS